MSKLQQWIDNRFYPGQDRRTLHGLFRKRILGLLREEDTVLDFGAGRGVLDEMNFRGLARSVRGVDVDPIVLENPHLDDAGVIEDGKIPYEDDKFDLVVSSYVMEHIQEPAVVFREIARVMKPGGLCIWRSPNRWHYVAVVASLTPHKFHEWVNAKRGREDRDTFPTVYRVNTIRAIRRYAEEAGFDIETIICDEGRPEYLRLTAPTYLLGTLFERFVNSCDCFSRLRANFTVTMRKRTAGNN